MSKRNVSLDALNFPQSGAPLVDQNRIITNEWRTLLNNLWDMAAGNMAQTTAVLIKAQFAPTTAASMYSSPAKTRTRVDKVTFTNTDSSAQTVTVNLVPSGESSSSSNVILDQKSIDAHTAYDATELQDQIMNAGDSIWVLASATTIVVAASGLQIK